MRFPNVEGPDKERPEPPKVVRAVSLVLAARKTTCFGICFCVFMFDAKYEKQGVALGRGPPQTGTDSQNRKRYQFVFHFVAH